VKAGRVNSAKNMNIAQTLCRVNCAHILALCRTGRRQLSEMAKESRISKRRRRRRRKYLAIKYLEETMQAAKAAKKRIGGIQ